MPVQILHRCFWGVVILWLTVVFCHQLSVDEIEHLHVAWLIGHRGLIPIHDFFQHHTPIIWDILALYYKFGGQGLEIIYFGRGINLLSAILTIAGLYVLGGHADKNESRITVPGMFGIIAFMLATAMITTMFAIRPETIGIVAFVWSCVLWMRRTRRTYRSYIFDLLAGILFGLAFVSSPRFILLGGVYLLFNRNTKNLFVVEPVRLAVLGFGTILSITGYVIFSYFGPNDFYFILTFSAFLQGIGEGIPLDADYIVLFSVLLAILYLVYRLDENKRGNRYQWATKSAYLLLLFLLTGLMSGNYAYSQDMIPLVIYICLMLVFFQPKLKECTNLKELAQGLVVGLLAFVLANHNHLVIGHNLINDDLTRIRLDRRIVPAGETVLLLANKHPLTVDNASFFVRPLEDAQDRVCSAVRLYPLSNSLPGCNYWEDLKNNRPYLVTHYIDRIVPREFKNQAKHFMRENYYKCERFYIRLPYTKAECLAHEAPIKELELLSSYRD